MENSGTTEGGEIKLPMRKKKKGDMKQKVKNAKPPKKKKTAIAIREAEKKRTGGQRNSFNKGQRGREKAPVDAGILHHKGG